VASGEGFFLVGDAAGVLDPSSSKGVLHAIMGGMLVGELATAITRKRVREQAAATVYQRWLVDWFDSDLARMSEWYREARVWSGSSRWT